MSCCIFSAACNAQHHHWCRYRLSVNWLIWSPGHGSVYSAIVYFHLSYCTMPLNIVQDYIVYNCPNMSLNLSMYCIYTWKLEDLICPFQCCISLIYCTYVAWNVWSDTTYKRKVILLARCICDGKLSNTWSMVLYTAAALHLLALVFMERYFLQEAIFCHTTLLIVRACVRLGQKRVAVHM